MNRYIATYDATSPLSFTAPDDTAAIRLAQGIDRFTREGLQAVSTDDGRRIWERPDVARAA